MHSVTCWPLLGYIQYVSTNAVPYQHRQSYYCACTFRTRKALVRWTFRILETFRIFRRVPGFQAVSAVWKGSSQFTGCSLCRNSGNWLPDAGRMGATDTGLFSIDDPLATAQLDIQPDMVGTALDMLAQGHCKGHRRQPAGHC